MERRVRRKSIALLSFMLCVLVVFGLVGEIVRKVSAEAEQLRQEYNLGDELYIPDYIIDGKAATEFSLLYPSGLLKEGRSHVLDEAGKYTVKYAAAVSGSVVTAENTFVVQQSMVGFKTKSSTSYYGVHEYAPNTRGLVVEIANGDSLCFNQIVDVGKMTKNDTLFKFFVTPNTIGQEDVSTIVVRMTDIYDESNYIDIQMRNLSAVYGDWADRQTYYAVKAGENPAVAGPSVNMWDGWPTYQSTTGIDPYGAPIGSNVPWQVRFDYENKDVLCPVYCLNDGHGGLPDWRGYPLADLDNPDYFETPWQGFTTGEVYISFYGMSYQAPTMNLLITEVAGIDLTKNVFLDETAPVIQVDLGDNDSVPEGLLNKGYKIFDATAVDSYDGVRKVNTNVYYNYGTRGQVSVYVKDGYFYPQIAGAYTIEYTATDTFGNKGVATVEVQIKDKTSGLDFIINGQKSSALAGEVVRVAESVGVSNAHGKYVVAATASLNGDEYVLTDLSFRPMKSGVYTVCLTVTDYVETVNKTFTLTVSDNNTPVFIEKAVLPKYLFAGDKYVIPELAAYDFSDGTAKKIVSEIYVSQDGGEMSQLNGILEVTATNNVVITYKANGTRGNAEYSYTIPVVAVTTGDVYDIVRNFKVLNGNVAINAGDSALGFETTENSKVRFINAVQAELFSTSFRWSNDTSKKNFGKVNLYLTDSVDENISIKITYYWKGGNAYFTVNDGSAVKISVSTTSIGKDVLSLYYTSETNQVYPSSSQKKNVTHTVNGDLFQGFPSNKVYVDYELVDVTGVSEFFIQSINNQSMCYWDGDFVEPQIFANRAKGDVAKDSLVTIYGGRAYDVLSNYVTLTLTVKDPSGNAVTSVDGIVLNSGCDASRDYVIKVSSFGEYKVEFVATDLSGTRKSLRYVFNVVDTVAPVIGLDTSDVTVSLNKTVTVRNCNISDDVTAKENLVLYVFVMTPSAQIQTVKNNRFEAKEKGTYVVYYYCCDEIGNVTISSYNVIVK